MIKRKTKKKTAAVIISCFIVLLLLLTACGQPSNENNKGYQSKVIKINYTTAYGSALPQILKLSGILEKAVPSDVKVEWVNINSNADIRDALVSGQIDIAVTAESTIISAIENGMPIVILGNSVAQSGKIYSNNPDIKSLDDIKATSKISIIGIGNTYDLALRIACKEKYGDPNKFANNLVAMEYADVFASLNSSKELDCAIMGFPNLQKADAIQTLSPIFDLTPYIRQYDMGTFIIANQKFYNENPGLIDIFYKAASEGIDIMNQKTETAAKMLSDFYGKISADVIAAQIKSVPPTLKISESAYNKVAEFMYEVKMLKNAPKKLSELPNYANIPKAD